MKKGQYGFCEPLANQDLALVFHCQYARYPVLEKATILMIRKVSGVPEGLKSDIGPPFNSPKFDEYGERIKMRMRIAPLQGKPVWEEVHRGIRAYRETMHLSTGESLNKMMLVRELPGKFLGVRAKVPVDQHDSNEVGKQKWEQKEKSKVYPDE